MRTDKSIIILISILVSFICIPAAAQEVVPEGYELVDSLVYIPVSQVDQTLVGKDVLDGLSVNQSAAVDSSARAHVRSNANRAISGYRIRIFFDNKQSARAESEAALKRFESLYHDIKAYRTYANPYFKVTAGDFRTKSEAMAFLNRIKVNFPSAFVVKESIAYPVVDKDNSYVVDTIKVLRPKVR
jgi:hypothetical protein